MASTERAAKPAPSLRIESAMPLKPFLATALAVSALGLAACSSGPDARGQLDALVEELGDGLIALSVNSINDSGPLVTIGKKEGEGIRWYSLYKGEIDEGTTSVADLLAQPRPADSFDLDALVARIDAIRADPECPGASAQEVIIDTGVAATASCDEHSGASTSLPEYATLDGEPAVYPAAPLDDPQAVAEAMAVFARVYGIDSAVMISMTDDLGAWTMSGAPRPMAEGGSCSPSVQIFTGAPTPAFPVICDPVEAPGGPSFPLTPSTAEAIAQTATEIRGSGIDEGLLIGIDFTANDTGFTWTANLDPMAKIDALNRDNVVVINPSGSVDLP